MKNLPSVPASETATLWEAVADRPLGGALHEMNSRGWQYVSPISGGLSGAHMKRGKRHATLVTRGGKVGMICLSDARGRV